MPFNAELVMSSIVLDNSNIYIAYPFFALPFYPITWYGESSPRPSHLSLFQRICTYTEVVLTLLLLANATIPPQISINLFGACEHLASSLSSHQAGLEKAGPCPKLSFSWHRLVRNVQSQIPKTLTGPTPFY